MKKINLFLLSLLLVATFARCGKNKQQSGDELPPPVELKLSEWIASVNKVYNVNKDIRIVSGNGGYRIVLPKKIQVGWYTENPQFIDYSDEILALHIDSNNTIVVERKVLNDQWISGYFMVADSKGQKRILVVIPQIPSGALYDIDEIESRLFNDPNYWQGYP